MKGEMLMTLEELLEDMEYSYDVDESLSYSGFKIKIFPTEEQREQIFTNFDIFDWCYNRALELHDTDNELTPREIVNTIKMELKSHPTLNNYTDSIIRLSVANYFDALDRSKHVKGCSNPIPKEPRMVGRVYQFKTETLRIGKDFVKLENVKDVVRTGYNNIPEKRKTAYSREGHLVYYRATVKYDGIDFWFSVNIKYPNNIVTIFKKTPEKTDPIGIDVGMKISAMCSNGWKFHTPMDEKRVDRVSNIDRWLSIHHKDPALELSELADIPYNDIPKSNNVKKMEKKRLKELRKTDNKKDSAIHEFTSQLIKENPRAIVMENFSVTDMAKGKPTDFCRELYAQCLYKIKEYTCYKCKRSGIPFVTADRNYPSTKRCSGCGNMDTEYMVIDSSRDRKFHCHKCGLVIDRDLNASYNLRDIVLDPNLYKYIYKIEYKGHTFIRKSDKENKEQC